MFATGRMWRHNWRLDFRCENRNSGCKLKLCNSEQPCFVSGVILRYGWVL